jgi:hypothetical protein
MSERKIIRAMLSPWRGPPARARDIVKVSVRDHNFQSVKTITSDPDLTAFREMWSTLIEAEPGLCEPGAGQGHYKLDIQWAKHSSRWLYDPAGFVKVLALWRAIWVAPLYKMPTPGEFNRLLRP